jgi:Zn-finger nucleic acid-binding protein
VYAFMHPSLWPRVPTCTMSMSMSTMYQVRIDEGDGAREVVVTREQLASLIASSSQGEDGDDPHEEAGADDDVDAVLGAAEDA